MANAVIFDWGGTISRRDIMESFAAALSARTGVSKKKIHMAFEKNNRRYLLGRMTGTVFWNIFSEETGIGKPPAFFIHLFVQAGKADPRMLALVKHIRKHCKTALLSDNYKELAEYIEKQYSLRELFDVLVFSNRVGMVKPRRNIFFLTLRRLGSRPDECVFIDDKEKNITAARKLGIRALRFRGYEKLKKGAVNWVW